MNSDFTLTNDSIPPKSYQQLRIACGLSPKSDQAVSIGLANTLYSASVIVDQEIAGMGRIIGDGGCFCQVVDICVHPEYQGRGMGKLIMENLRDFIENKLPTTCYVSLIADGDASYLYERFGFKDTLPKSKGMYLKVEHD
jgi:ribosomal protein S18 acetylase RimI-like enzyme